MYWYRLTQFVITKALPYIFTSFGYGTWFFFATWMLLATIWSFFFLPETKGLTLDQIDVVLYVFVLSALQDIQANNSSGYKHDRQSQLSDASAARPSIAKDTELEKGYPKEHAEES